MMGIWFCKFGTGRLFDSRVSGYQLRSLIFNSLSQLTMVKATGNQYYINYDDAPMISPHVSYKV